MYNFNKIDRPFNFILKTILIKSTKHLSILVSKIKKDKVSDSNY